MIPAGWSELKFAFERHYFVGRGTNSISHNLLLFYGVECGLKSIYLRRNKLKDTSQIMDGDLRKSHDLIGWVKQLRLPASLTSSVSHNFRLRRSHSSYSLEFAHQVWRYGIAIHQNDEFVLLAWLNRIADWIKENIHR